MDNLLQVLVYVIAVIIYAIFKMKKRPDVWPENNPPTPAPKQSLPHTTPAKSFADAPPKQKAPSLNETIKKLEKEINQSKKNVKPNKPLSQEEIFGDKSTVKGNVKKKEYGLDPYVPTYENVEGHFEKIQNFSEIRNYEEGYQERTKIFEYPEESKQNENQYKEFLKDPENIKTAFVMKEIFDRNYF